MKLLIKNIKSLVNIEDEPRKWVAGKDMQKLNTIDNAYLLIEEDRIADFGMMSECKADNFNGQTIDATGKMVFPSFCDSHTHLVYAGKP